GVAMLDVGGAGGTSFALVEGYRRPDSVWKKVALSFGDWGIPTAESLRLCRTATPDVPLIASGGIRSGIDAAKALALGASWCSVSGAIVAAAAESSDAVFEWFESLIQELRLAMFALGVQGVTDLTEDLLWPVANQRQPPGVAVV
ncbi:MAG: alpha-hydroxy-acid oxidizing protein, partial [Cyanobacteria bacterium REEB65]|nr:alpha-hydroxy-acid oxidizing protein [Cyanobacteria bacterium REEB65]